MENYLNRKSRFIYKENILKLVRRDWQLIVIISLPAMFFIIFNYLPMYGLVIAFKDYRIGRGIIGSEWVGFRWFEQFFSSYFFFRLIRNTFLLSVYNIVFATPIPIIFALCLDEMRKQFLKKAAQTISYAPYFISTVVVVGIMYNFLSVNSGIVNMILNKLGYESINFMSSVEWFRTLYISSGIWQSFGFNSIIYLAALTSVDIQLIEAVEIDGGNRFHKIWYIKLPSIKPTFIILMIFAVGSIFSVGFEKIILMYSPGIYDVSDVISTYVYRAGILESKMSYATAIGFFNSVINFIFIIAFNYIARKTQETSLW